MPINYKADRYSKWKDKRIKNDLNLDDEWRCFVRSHGNSDFSVVENKQIPIVTFSLLLFLLLIRQQRNLFCLKHPPPRKETALRSFYRLMTTAQFFCSTVDFFIILPKTLKRKKKTKINPPYCGIFLQF